MIKLIIFDYGGTIYNPLNDKLYSGAKKLLGELRDLNFKLALVSKAEDANQRLNDFQRFGLENYFEVMEASSGKKPKNFIHILKKFNVSPNQCLIIGDYVKSEIKEGNKIGTTTIWVKNGEFPNVLPQTKQEKPDYIIESLEEIIPLINTF
jgi:FMN phosphatase YigB (HAD superfamily)